MSRTSHEKSVLSELLARIRAGMQVKSGRVHVDDLTNNDCIILLMGPPGSGKNTFMEVVAGTKIPRRKPSEHLETLASAIRLSLPNRIPALAEHDPNIVLVNNPAFNDVGKSDKEILHLISGWLQQTYQRGIHVSGVIFFHRISDAKLEGTPMRNWRALEKICGDRFENVVIATTMWGEVDDGTGEARKQQLLHLVGNYPTQKFDHANRASAAEILAPILEHRAKRPLLLQSEISDHHLSLKQTSAARALYAQLEPLRSVYDRKQEVILDALSKASDKERVEELIEQRGIWEARIDRIEKEQDELKESLGDRLQGHLLRMLGLGFVLRPVGLPRRPAEEVVDFERPGGENEQ